MPTFLYKLIFFLSLLSVTISVPIISAGITFGSPIYRPVGTPIYYERPYGYYHDGYYHDGYYHDGPSRYPYEHSHNYEYVSGGLGGFLGSLSYAPLII